MLMTTLLASMPQFEPHLVGKLPDGYQIAVADMNGDGRPDILALSTRTGRVVWYENPGWKEHPIITSLPDPISLAPVSGAREIALATDFALSNSTSGGRVWLLHRPPADSGEWVPEEIDAIPTSHRLKWADLDGDGQLELVNAPLLGYGAKAPDYAVPAPFVWYQREGGKWQRHVIDETLRLLHGFAVVRWDGDKRDSLLTASAEGVYLFQSSGRAAGMKWSKTLLGDGGAAAAQPATPASQPATPRTGASEVCLGRLGKRRFIATIEPWHGNQVAVYLETAAKPWSRQVLDAGFNNGHALACGDLNGDGRDEIVAGYRGKGSSLYAYFAEDADGRQWRRIPLDEGDMAASGCVIVDVNSDGRPDIVAIGASSGNVKWYENTGGGKQ
ncbi:MAG: VCBS repeat-containing protein [Acidobacteria bacterium]|nr:VCBS repeat-containing protein [Acidobacteriota bacterium]